MSERKDNLIPSDVENLEEVGAAVRNARALNAAGVQGLLSADIQDGLRQVDYERAKSNALLATALACGAAPLVSMAVTADATSHYREFIGAGMSVNAVMAHVNNGLRVAKAEAKLTISNADRQISNEKKDRGR